MGRRRTEGVQLPEGVQVVRKPSGKAYYYYAPKRSTKAAEPRVSLPSDPRDPAFWLAYRKAKGLSQATGSYDRLIEAFKASPEWERLRPATQRDYASYLDRLSAVAGDRPVTATTRADVYELRDQMSDTPVAANHMLSVLRTLLEWSIPRAYRTDNPVVGVQRLKLEDEGGAAPWPEPAYRHVLTHAPTDLKRMAVLGRTTGQRAGDLVRMRGVDLATDGINLKIGKRREKTHFVPLTKAQMIEIRSWGVEPMDLFIKSTRGKRYSATHLNSRWNRWRETEEAQPIRDQAMTIHGLRATKIADLAAAGVSDRSIADEIGLSPQQVNRYLRFADKARAARLSRDRRERSEA